jgi:hypothetical protein
VVHHRKRVVPTGHEQHVVGIWDLDPSRLVGLDVPDEQRTVFDPAEARDDLPFLLIQNQWLARESSTTRRYPVGSLSAGNLAR